MTHDLVAREPLRAETLYDERPDTPAVGRWYWVTGEEDKSLACVTGLGSNYVKLTYADGNKSIRIHHDRFWLRCTFVEDPNAVLQGNADRCKRELNGLLEDVKLLTTKLGIAPSLALGSGEGTGVALALASSAPAEAYKTALVLAKEETLPALFEQIRKKSDELSQWLGASIIPVRAEAEKLEPVVKKIEDRIFSVQLYAGLCEEVEHIQDGEPAALIEPVHLFQRRLYMDEECLANYDTGGMEFKNLRAFERWLCRKDNLARVLPFPRTVVAFQVRHVRKEREVCGFRDFIHLLDAEKLDKMTFLYIRNGDQVYRLSTAIDFGERLFPDADHPTLMAGEGNLYAKGVDGFDGDFKVIGEAEYLALVDADVEADREYKRRVKEEAKKPKAERAYISKPSYFDGRARPYEPFTRDNVYYDDTLRRIQSEMEKHNRIVLVLQGLLDRSLALHPHPPWRLYDGDGFGQAVRLHRDMDRVLAPGDQPDFEAYRTRCNASLTHGSVAVGQEDYWERFEARKENARRDQDRRWSRTEYRPKTWRPEYKPGDYKRFYTDPRTREQYLQWAPLLLAAEEYHAGRHSKVPPIAAPPKPAKRAAPTGEADRLRARRAWLGQAVRITRPIETKGGNKYAKGSLWRVTDLDRRMFTIVGIRPGGELDGDRSVRCVSQYSFVAEPKVPFDPKYAFQPIKRERLPTMDDGDLE
jgi:hypothetical protein